MKSLVLYRGLLWAGLLGALSGGLGGCSLVPSPSTDPTRYFVLASPAPAPTTPRARNVEALLEASALDLPQLPPRPSGVAHDLLLGLRALELPTYLRTTKSIVVRRDSHEIHYEDFARWGEPLEAGLQRLLRERLLASVRVAQVAIPPFPFDSRRDYEISVRILHCEGAMQGDQAWARFAAVYEIFPGGNPTVPSIRRTLVSSEVPWDGKDPATLVALLSEAAERFGQEIANNLPL